MSLLSATKPAPSDVPSFQAERLGCIGVFPIRPLSTAIVPRNTKIREIRDEIRCKVEEWCQEVCPKESQLRMPSEPPIRLA